MLTCHQSGPTSKKKFFETAIRFLTPTGITSLLELKYKIYNGRVRAFWSEYEQNFQIEIKAEKSERIFVSIILIYVLNFNKDNKVFFENS